MTQWPSGAKRTLYWCTNCSPELVELTECDDWKKTRNLPLHFPRHQEYAALAPRVTGARRRTERPPFSPPKKTAMSCRLWAAFCLGFGVAWMCLWFRFLSLSGSPPWPTNRPRGPPIGLGWTQGLWLFLAGRKTSVFECSLKFSSQAR